MDVAMEAEACRAGTVTLFGFASLVPRTKARKLVLLHCRLDYGLHGAAYAYNFLTILEVGMLVLCVCGHHLYMKRFGAYRGFLLSAAMIMTGVV
eukprot:1147222-Pelagomonas_calceolata.AAC.4